MSNSSKISKEVLWPNFENDFEDTIQDQKWKAILLKNRDLLDTLCSHVEASYKKFNGYFNILPPKKLVMNAMIHTPFDQVKVVIIGQDPYIKKEQPIGMSFAVNKGVTVPPSLKNIYGELSNDPKVDFTTPVHGDLTGWADQGVLLLNASLTVVEGSSNSHACFTVVDKDTGKKTRHRWSTFTDAIIKEISSKRKGVVFMLWGNNAKKKEPLIDASKHLVLKSAHPSPLSANRGGWFGCQHFSKANEYLKTQNQTAIDWSSLP